MQIGERIKEHRARLGLSQDDLAARIYVSRQTISSWENDKTYPDVQSLLLLSEMFDATVDDLVKGDVETMTKSVEHDVRLMKRLSWVMVALLLLMIAALDEGRARRRHHAARRRHRRLLRLARLRPHRAPAGRVVFGQRLRRFVVCELLKGASRAGCALLMCSKMENCPI